MKQKINEFYLSIGDIKIKVLSELPLIASEGLQHFFVPSDNAVTIYVKELKENICIDGAMLYGEDLHFSYYKDSQYYYSIAKAGVDGSVSSAVYTSDFKECTLYINENDFPGVIQNVDMVLQLFPFRHLLFIHHGIILHSSRVVVNGKAILFSAPSQTGKSTQANLWEHYAGAEIVSNDRSIIRQKNDDFYTYGYPIDGSDPIYDNSRIPLGTIVILSQGSENHVERLSVLPAIQNVLEQTVNNPWDDNGSVVRDFWLNLVERYPIYHLTCRPDKEAVMCLKERLEKDEVI